jgi:hypothetical protein
MTSDGLEFLFLEEALPSVDFGERRDLRGVGQLPVLDRELERTAEKLRLPVDLRIGEPDLPTLLDVVANPVRVYDERPHGTEVRAGRLQVPALAISSDRLPE